jgi:hypothetical protein
MEKTMRILFSSAFLSIGMAFTFITCSEVDGKCLQPPLQVSTPSDTPVVVTAKNDSVGINQTGNMTSVDSTRVIITVEPVEANDADVTLIMEEKAKVYRNAMRLTQVGPDTLGKWNAPLSLMIARGFYDIVLHKEGFRDIIETMHQFTRKRDSLSITMVSFASIEQRRELFGNIKWISAGIAVAASAVSLYFYEKLKTREQEYNNATSPDVIQEKRNSIEANRRNYRISTGVVGAGIAGFGVSWVVEISL